MDNNYVITSDGNLISTEELKHWGIPGMKWGLRRYQNKDGSLTPAGRKRYNAEVEALKKRERLIRSQEKAAARQAKLANKKAELDARENALKNDSSKNNSKAPDRKKTINEMSDDELRNETNRMRLEADYHNAKKSLATANPQEVKAGKKFMDGLMNDVVVPATKNAGKAWLENYLKDALGVNKQDRLTRLKRQYEEADYEKKIADLKKGADELSKLKKEHEILDYEKKIADLKNPKPKELTPDEQTKMQTYTKGLYETERAKRDWDAYMREKETLGDEAAWERYKAKQGGK